MTYKSRNDLESLTEIVPMDFFESQWHRNIDPDPNLVHNHRFDVQTTLLEHLDSGISLVFGVNTRLLYFVGRVSLTSPCEASFQG